MRIARPITDEDNPESIVRKMAALEVEAIEETKNEMDLEQLQRIVGWMQNAKIIDYYAYDQNFYLIRCRHSCSFLSHNYLENDKYSEWHDLT